MARYPSYRGAQASRAVSEVEALIVDTAALAYWFSADGSWRAQRQRRLRVRRALRTLLLGMTGALALLLSGVVLASRWAAGRLRPVKRQALARELPRPADERDSASQLAAATARWVERERRHLPPPADEPLQRIVRRVAQLASQQERLPAESEERRRLQRLIAEELPELVQSYRRLPTYLTQHAVLGAQPPDQQLLSGLALIDDQLVQLQERLAERDLQALSTHFRYLELKYAPASQAPGGAVCHSVGESLD